MSRTNLFWLLGIAAVSLFGFAVSYSAPTRERDKDYQLVRLVVDVLHEVRQRYVIDIDPERERKLVEDMINGGLERLDPHSAYINPRDYKQFDKQSRYYRNGRPRGSGGVEKVTPLPHPDRFQGRGQAFSPRLAAARGV